MQVKVISYSQMPKAGPEGLDPAAGDPDLLELIAYCARVSNPANQNNKKTALGLVKYLMKHKHWSP